jgi:alkylation response protein AidB-like acyl-CoA dehydrogenase
MRVQLTPDQERAAARFAAFADEHIAPHANGWDRTETMPRSLAGQLGERGYLGAAIGERYGGSALDAITFGLLNEEIGRACSSVRSLLTVHSMVSYAVGRWGTEAQKSHWLPELAAGRCIGAFALTELGAGSDVRAMAARAERAGGGFVLNGEKRWITFGQYAGVFLVFARLAGREAAFLVERDSPGLEVVPQSGILGTRASMLAEVRLRDCELPASALLSRPGFGLSAVGASALELGRFSVAWGCVGLIEACAEASMSYADTREQFDRRLREHQLIQQMLADMVTNASAARLLCQQAGWLREAGDTRSVHATWLAKYFAAGAAFRAASDAVQIHGAQGIGDAYPVQRYLRDAKVMEIIEGSTQLQQVTIAHSAYQQRRPLSSTVDGALPAFEKA